MVFQVPLALVEVVVAQELAALAQQDQVAREAEAEVAGQHQDQMLAQDGRRLYLMGLAAIACQIKDMWDKLAALAQEALAV
jgi:hypothetical protein